MREIILDTETTGLDLAVDRIVEIGCVELLNHIPSGRFFHVYLNPDRLMPAGAFEVHGLSDAFLADKPRFAEKADEFIAFIAGAVLIAHNAEFDMAFLNAELARLGRGRIEPFRVIDTLMLARRRHPGAVNTLDGLCARYGVDLSRRSLHGALLDANLLAEVYIELIGGRQASLMLGDVEETLALMPMRPRRGLLERPRPLPPRLGGAELAAHARLVASLDGAAIWRRYAEVSEAAE